MKKQEVERIYKFADSTLITKGLEGVAFMRRDDAEFLTYGIESTEIDELETNINEFADRLTDIESLGDQKQATADKDLEAESLRTAIRGVMSRVVLTYPESSPKYKKFGTDELSKQTDADLLITAKRVVRVGTDLLSDLSGNGLTLVMLDDIEGLANKFSDSIVSLKIEIGDRDIEQEDRVEAGNVIYTTLSKYCKTGQSIWETSDVAKYNDYVIYNTISGEPDDTPPTP